MKKVTLQDIADSVGISRISVWKVFSGRDGVSDELRKKVIAKAKEMNYNFPKDFEMPDDMKQETKPLNISVTVSLPKTSIFWMPIIHEIAKELSKQNVNLIYTYLPTHVPEDYNLPTQLINGTIDGIIILNEYNLKLIHKLSALAIPKVFLDTSAMIRFDELNGDLILSTGKSCLTKIIDYLIEQNKTNIGFLGDINSSRANRERYENFINIMERHNLPIIPYYCITSSLDTNCCEKKLRQMIDQTETLPNAFICANDPIAYFASNIIKERGLRIPEDIFLTGFDCSQELIANQLTNIQSFSKDIGLRLATQILYKINNPLLRHELIYISSEVAWGKLP